MIFDPRYNSWKELILESGKCLFEFPHKKKIMKWLANPATCIISDRGERDNNVFSF